MTKYETNKLLEAFRHIQQAISEIGDIEDNVPETSIDTNDLITGLHDVYFAIKDELGLDRLKTINLFERSE